jgi:AraC-like DNA-binding protein
MIDFNMDVDTQADPRTPRAKAPCQPMDPLSDVLRAIRMDGACFYAVDASGRWGVETEAAPRLVPRIMPTARHLIACHIITSGQCVAGLIGERPVELAAGDVVLFPHGDAHLLASAADFAGGPVVSGVAGSRAGETLVVGDGGPGGASLVSGFLGWDFGPFNPLLVSLPRLMHVRGMSIPWLGHFTRQMMEESRLGRPGADCLLARLAELMFIEVVRRYLDEPAAAQTGWAAGLRDATVGRALALVHAHPGHPWTLADLAQQVASSRSRLSERFTALMGTPPMQYLTQWRMQVAANLLLQTSAKVAAIGNEVAYDSEAAFSRAFKRATGVAPAAWRDAGRRARAS